MTKDELAFLFYYCSVTGGLIWKYNESKTKAVNARLCGKYLGGLDSCREKIMRGHINGKKYSISRLVWIYHNGEIEGFGVIRHKDGDNENTKIENLELSSRSICQGSRSRKSATGKKGVYAHKNKFKVEIKVGGVKKYIGLFNTLEDAALEYDLALLEYCGEAASTNAELDLKDEGIF